ncbi:hypothetical protein [Xenorhabdus sp. SGI246]|uniref:hypothetical protein n=1 Tax=Xenorhabdus sp. SGI246 TaxID=3158263 RepID=UPI00349FCE6D
MKIENIKTISDFMLYCKYPYWYQSKIKEMKLGDTLFMGQYREKIKKSHENYFVAEAWIEKHRGYFSFYATWTFPTKEKRCFIMTSGKFKIKNSQIFFFNEKESEIEKENVRLFSLVCRYLHCILKSFSSDDCQAYFKKGTTPLLMGVRVNQDWIGYKKSFIDSNVKKPCFLSYANNAPHQLHAIVSASMALGLIKDE